jgi:ubiquinone/menaquinone biosynthesis C-methylase UbiE
MMKINIGAGDNKVDGFINLDYDKNSDPDYIIDLEKDRLPFDDNTVDTVIASHVLEHLGDGYFHCLQELYRVCKHGAVIHVSVPYHRNDNFYDDPTHRRAITVRGMKMFGKKYNQLAREQKVHSSRLGDFFNVDFEVVEWSYLPEEKYRKKFEGLPKEQVEEYIEEHCNIIHEVYMKVVVIKNDFK